MDSVDRDPLERRLGAQMGGWRLERLLGAGGMAAVYLGRSADGSTRAIKVLHSQVARDRNLRARFAQEVEAVSRLDHPGIVRIEDMGADEDGSPFMVMELLEGETLHDRLSRGLPPIDEALALTDALLDALAVAHAGRIIHRDIKPDNLFVHKTGLKVLDFGIAKVRRESIAEIKTETGTALGTPSYMAQEQIKAIDVDHRADLFAAGAVLFRMLTGRRVHDDADPQVRLLKMLTTPAPPVRTVAPQLSEGLAMVVDRAVAFEPDDRYPDARTMQTDVRAVRAGHAPPYASTAPPIPPRGAALVASRSPSAAPTTPSEPTMATRVGSAQTPPSSPALSPPPAEALAVVPAPAATPTWVVLAIVVLSVLAGVLVVLLVAL